MKRLLSFEWTPYGAGVASFVSACMYLVVLNGIGVGAFSTGFRYGEELVIAAAFAPAVISLAIPPGRTWLAWRRWGVVLFLAYFSDIWPVILLFGVTYGLYRVWWVEKVSPLSAELRDPQGHERTTS